MTQKEGIKQSGIFLATGNILSIFLQKGHLRYIFAKVEIDPGYFRYIFVKGLNFNQGNIKYIFVKCLLNIRELLSIFSQKGHIFGIFWYNLEYFGTFLAYFGTFCHILGIFLKVLSQKVSMVG